MKYCSKCLLPETHETIEFDEEAVCNICRQHEYKRDNNYFGTLIAQPV